MLYYDECKGLSANHAFLWHALLTILKCILYVIAIIKLESASAPTTHTMSNEYY